MTFKNVLFWGILFSVNTLKASSVDHEIMRSLSESGVAAVCTLGFCVMKVTDLKCESQLNSSQSICQMIDVLQKRIVRMDEETSKSLQSLMRGTSASTLTCSVQNSPGSEECIFQN